MQSALLVSLHLPPPPAGTLVLPGLDGPCTGLAPDARKAFVMELVIRDVMEPDEIPDVVAVPVDQRIDLDASVVVVVDLDKGEIITGGRLFLAQPRNPHVISFKGTVQRFYLSDVAT